MSKARSPRGYNIEGNLERAPWAVKRSPLAIQHNLTRHSKHLLYRSNWSL